MTNFNRPKVTVFIPVFNREQYIGDAIDSILAQTFTDFEILLIDDASLALGMVLMALSLGVSMAAQLVRDATRARGA